MLILLSFVNCLYFKWIVKFDELSCLTINLNLYRLKETIDLGTRDLSQPFSLNTIVLTTNLFFTQVPNIDCYIPGMAFLCVVITSESAKLGKKSYSQFNLFKIYISIL